MTASQGKKTLKVVLVGQPNVGKSCLLNALVGPCVTISNYPGTTVETTQAKREIGGTSFIFVDSPGTYSLSDRSEDERATKHALLSNDMDVAVIVLDACSLERGLYFALQVIESGVKTVIAMNFIEDAIEKGITIEYDRLGRLLGVPVVPFNPFTKRGLDDLIDEIRNASRLRSATIDVLYDDHIESVISMLIEEGLDISLPTRFVALRILEEDKDFLHLVNKTTMKRITDKISKDCLRITEDIARMRYGTASFLATQGTKIIHRETRKKEVIDSLRIDKWLLHRFGGPAFTLLFFSALFYTLLVVGGAIQCLLMTVSEDLIALIPVDGGFLTQMLIDGLTGVTAGVAMALPYVFLFYIILGLTEDIGLLPRFVVNVQRTLRFFHIPERGFISLMLGLGCTVPAVTSTRIIRERDQRVRLIFLYAFVPCSSRLGIILGVVAFYGGDRLVLPLFATLGIAALFWLLIMRILSKDKLDPILLELPTYRRPMISNIAHKSWLRMREFVVVVIPLLILGGVMYSLIDQLGGTAVLIGPFAFVTEGLLGLPAETIIPILFGFVQKDLTGAMLVSVLGGDVAAVMTPLQMFTFGVVTSIGIPCMIVLPAMSREIGWKNTFVIFVTTGLFSLVVASTAWRIALLFGFT